jgi:hypothetical protein
VRDYRSPTPPPVNVTPPGAAGSTDRPPYGASGWRRWGGDDATDADPNNPDWGVWSRTGGHVDGQPGVSWLGVLLVLLGAALFINQVNRAIDVGSLVVLALGIAFGAAWLIGGWRSATVPALVLVAMGLAGLASGLGYVRGPGWSWLAVGIAFLIGWAVGPFQKRHRAWAMWVGLILGVYGFAEVSPQLVPDLPDMPWLWPLVLVGIGVVLLMRRRLDDGHQPGRNRGS